MDDHRRSTKASLIHEVLESSSASASSRARSAARRAVHAARPRPTGRDCRGRYLHDLEARAAPAIRSAWENARAVIVRDLHLQLEREDAWRTEDGLAPALFERTFGDSRDPDSWPAVEVALGDGLEVRFRGAIDRVDLSPVRPRAWSSTTKRGGVWGYDGLDEDPVLAGRHVQLALYARALRAWTCRRTGAG